MTDPGQPLNLIDAYLRAVELLLPHRQREDIIAELREMILSRIEAEEARLGRPLTEAELEGVLRGVGHPLMVAARYRGGPQHLVGPTLYPYWRFAAQASVVLMAVIGVLIFITHSLATADPARAFGQAFGAAFSGLIMLIGLVTLAACAVERFGLRIGYLETWRVRDLRFIELAAWDLDSLADRWRRWNAGPTPGGPSRPDAPPSPPPQSPPQSPPPSGHGYQRAATFAADVTAAVSQRADRYAWRAERQQARWQRREARWQRRIAWRRRRTAAQGLNALVGGALCLLWLLGVLPFDLIGNTHDLHQLGLDPGPVVEADWLSIRAALWAPAVLLSVAVMLRGAIVLTWPRSRRMYGLMDLVIGLAILQACAWIWTASPLAQIVQVNSLSGFVVRVIDAFQSAPPLALGPMLDIVLLFFVLDAISRVFRGALDIVLPWRWTAWDASAAPRI